MSQEYTLPSSQPSPWQQPRTGRTGYGQSKNPWVAHLNACVTAQVEVKLERMSDAGVHCSACWNIATLPNLPIRAKGQQDKMKDRKRMFQNFCSHYLQEQNPHNCDSLLLGFCQEAGGKKRKRKRKKKNTVHRVKSTQSQTEVGLPSNPLSNKT